MNTRRTFFKSLCFAAPALFLPKLIPPPVWKANANEATVNPAWHNAEYEIVWLSCEWEGVKSIIPAKFPVAAIREHFYNPVRLVQHGGPFKRI